VKKLLLAPTLFLVSGIPCLSQNDKTLKERPSILTFSDKSRISGFPKSVEAEKKQLIFDSSSLEGLSILNTKKLLEMTLNGSPKKIELIITPSQPSKVTSAILTETRSGAA
jgi:hypothetical protein